MPQILNVTVLCGCGMTVQIPYAGRRATCLHCHKLYILGDGSTIMVKEGDPYR